VPEAVFHLKYYDTINAEHVMVDGIIAGSCQRRGGDCAVNPVSYVLLMI